VVLVLLAMAWIPIINSFTNSQLFVYIQSISSFLTPPVAATFLLAIFWHRTTEPGAFWGLMCGFCCGIIRFGLEFRDQCYQTFFFRNLQMFLIS
jgi:Na+/proline symporter